MTDLEKAKAALRIIQDKWDAAGKVPRGDMERVEKAMRRIEQTVRDAEDRAGSRATPRSRPAPRAMVDQLERAVADLQRRPRQGRGVRQREQGQEGPEALEARRAWLDQARAGVAEFGG